MAALEGHESDGTPFNELDLDDIKNRLETFGYEKNGDEYLYNGMTGKRIKSMFFIGPTYYQRLKHMVSDKIHCLTLDHEVLTDKGWKFFHQISFADKIATLKDGKLAYDRPLDLLYYPDYKGQLYHIKSQQVDLNVTTNHRMYVSFERTRKRIWTEHSLVKAEDIFGKHVKYKKNADWGKKDYQFVLPAITDKNNIMYDEIKFDMNAWLTYFGIWIAEGWTSNTRDKIEMKDRSNLVIICQCKQRVKDIIYKTCSKLGLNYYCNKDGDKIIINNKQLYTYLEPLSTGAPNKKLPDWVWQLSSNQCRLLIESMILGDGTYKKNTKENGICYYTSSIQLADDFMRLCLHAGWSSNKTLHLKKGKITYYKGRKITSKYDLWRLSVIRDKNTPAVNHGHTQEQKIQIEEIIDYEGDVFCLQVPSEIFYVRRNGLPVWTGNSRSRGPRTLLTRRKLASVDVKTSASFGFPKKTRQHNQIAGTSYNSKPNQYKCWWNWLKPILW